MTTPEDKAQQKIFQNIQKIKHNFELEVEQPCNIEIFRTVMKQVSHGTALNGVILIEDWDKMVNSLPSCKGSKLPSEKATIEHFGRHNVVLQNTPRWVNGNFFPNVMEWKFRDVRFQNQ